MDDEGASSSVASMANKCPCCSPPLHPPLPAGPNLSPPLPSLSPPDLNKESLLHTFVCSSFSLDASVENILDSQPSDSDKRFFIDHALSRVSALADAVNRYARKMAFRHNCQVWALPPDLTIKVCCEEMMLF